MGLHSKENWVPNIRSLIEKSLSIWSPQIHILPKSCQNDRFTVNWRFGAEHSPPFTHHLPWWQPLWGEARVVPWELSSVWGHLCLSDSFLCPWIKNESLWTPGKALILYATLHMQRDTRGRFLPLFATEFKALINIIDATGLNSGSVPVGR